jgi:hypothetical protein
MGVHFFDCAAAAAARTNSVANKDVIVRVFMFRLPRLQARYFFTCYLHKRQAKKKMAHAK